MHFTSMGSCHQGRQGCAWCCSLPLRCPCLSCQRLSVTTNEGTTTAKGTHAAACAHWHAKTGQVPVPAVGRAWAGAVAFVRRNPRTWVRKPRAEEDGPGLQWCNREPEWGLPPLHQSPGLGWALGVTDLTSWVSPEGGMGNLA